MSVETLVLLALFIVLPLIQQVIRATRERNRRLSEPGEEQSPSTFAPTPPVQVVVPPLPNTTPHAASAATTTSGRVPSPQPSGPATIGLTPDRTAGHRTAVGLHTRRDLRRAIVVMATLGPCRANSPYHRSEQSGTLMSTLT